MLNGGKSIKLLQKPRTLYQNPDDFPPGGFLTLIIGRGPPFSNSSARKMIKNPSIYVLLNKILNWNLFIRRRKNLITADREC